VTGWRSFDGELESLPSQARQLQGVLETPASKDCLAGAAKLRFLTETNKHLVPGFEGIFPQLNFRSGSGCHGHNARRVLSLSSLRLIKLSIVDSLVNGDRAFPDPPQSDCKNFSWPQTTKCG
jgi:hypothetical protein